MTVTTTKDINYLSISSEINNILKKKRMVYEIQNQNYFYFYSWLYYFTMVYSLSGLNYFFTYNYLYHVNIFSTIVV